MRKPYLTALLLSIGLLALLALILSGPASSVEAGPNDLDVILYFPIIAKNYNPSAVPVTLKGHVVQANGDGPIQGAVVCASDYCDTTDSQGYYELNNVLSGFRHLGVKAGGSIPISENIYLPPDAISEMHIAMVIDTLPVNTLQIVLTWKGPWRPPPHSGDLDAHLWITNTVLAETFHINASDAATYHNCDLTPYACYILDDDDEDGYGPETIMVTQVQDGQTSYAVNNYYLGIDPLVPITSQTGATVRVFRGGEFIGEHINTFTVPSTGTGDLWYVFDIQKSGLTPQIVPKNCITYYSPSVLPACASP
jgi:hypothetical protein